MDFLFYCAVRRYADELVAPQSFYILLYCGSPSSLEDVWAS